MTEYAYRPVSLAYERQERLALDRAEIIENLDIISLDYEPVSVYYDQQVSDPVSDRQRQLTDDERQSLMERVMAAYGLPGDGLDSIIRLHSADADASIIPNPATSAGGRPSLFELVNSLADDSKQRHQTSEFNVGLLLRLPVGLLALKFNSQTIGQADDYRADDLQIYKYQLELYPSAMAAAINWEIF